MHLHNTGLLEKDNLTTIHNRNIQLVLAENFKVKNELSPPFMSKSLMENAQHYYLRTEFKRYAKMMYNRTDNFTILRPKGN